MRCERGDGDETSAGREGGSCVDGVVCEGNDEWYAGWLSTPRASDMEGKDCLTVCLIASFSSPLVRRDSGGVRMVDGVDAVVLEWYCVGGAGWLYGGGGPEGY